MRTIQIKAYKYDELSEQAKERAIQNYRDSNYLDYPWWEGLIELDELLPDKIKEGFSEKQNIVRALSKQPIIIKMFKWEEMYFDMDYRGYVKFEKLEVKYEAEELLRQFLKIPKSLWKKLDGFWDFSDNRECTTRLEFDEQILVTAKQNEFLERAKGIFDDLMSKALKILRDEYNYMLSDEYIKDNIINNEWEFEENGEKI